MTWSIRVRDLVGRERAAQPAGDLAGAVDREDPRLAA